MVLATGERIESPPIRSAVRNRRSGIEVRDLTGGFLGGQESAVVNQLNGGPAVPRDPHTPVYARGVAGRPTLVVNVETLAQVALLVRFGPDWFRSQGTPEDPGTFLVTLTGALRPGVQEVARGSRLGALLDGAGADRTHVSGVLLGGYHGTWLPPEAFDVALSTTGLAAYGARPGAGIVHALDSRRCPLRVSADVVSYLARNTSGQCGPCINGMPRMADTLQRLARPGADARLVGEVARLRGLITGRGACAHPDGSARFAMSTLATFSEHVDAHLEGACHVTAAD
jgi:NADH:ubiquinone oxidoreductase subunit F (NADH-binding)